MSHGWPRLEVLDMLIFMDGGVRYPKPSSRRTSFPPKIYPFVYDHDKGVGESKTGRIELFVLKDLTTEERRTMRDTTLEEFL